MISLIICSKDKAFLKQLSANVEATIGVPYEIVVIDNSTGQFSISQAYNKGTLDAHYDILVYVHEDVIFHTKLWGQKLVEHFTNDPLIGGIGIAGALYKTRSPSTWWEVDNGMTVKYLVQHIRPGDKRLEEEGWNNNEISKEVAVIDGVFMAIRKNAKVEFDSSIPGFHCYDLCISIRLISSGFKIIVVRNILIEHYSLGNINKGWVEASSFLHKKYSNSLPISSKHYIRITKEREFKNLYWFVNTCLQFKARKITLQYWLRLLLMRPYSLRMHYRILRKIMS